MKDKTIVITVKIRMVKTVVFPGHGKSVKAEIVRKSRKKRKEI